MADTDVTEDINDTLHYNNDGAVTIEWCPSKGITDINELIKKGERLL